MILPIDIADPKPIKKDRIKKDPIDGYFDCEAECHIHDKECSDLCVEELKRSH